jgi:SAM-dependent methyltransferase
MATKIVPYTISPDQAATVAYRDAFAAELESGAAATLTDLASQPINQPAILAYKARILAGLDSTRHYAEWAGTVLRQYGPRPRGLSLGSGLGRVEQHLAGIGFTTFDAVDLAAAVNGASRLESDKLRVHEGDLNFLELPPDTYDFILCHGVLHHLINLEHVLHHINAALKPDGLLLVYEYVGESRWQFTAERMAWLHRTFPRNHFAVPPPWSVGGFESVRSADLLALLNLQFSARTISAVSYGGVFFPFLKTVQDKSAPSVQDLIVHDEDASKSGEPPPCYHMGLYQKCPAARFEVRPWSDAEVLHRLVHRPPLRTRGIQAFKRTRAGAALRRVKRFIN